MAFLMDAPMLVASGAAISRLAPDEAVACKLEQATAITFIAGAAAFYLKAPGFNQIAKKVFRSEDGREFMVNSMVLNFDHRKLRGSRHLIAVGLLASYPLWLRLGRRLGARPPGAQPPRPPSGKGLFRDVGLLPDRCVLHGVP